MNSLFSLTETLASLVFHPFYSWIYMKTLYAFPGTVFLISAALIVPAAFILTFFFVQHRKEIKNARKTALEADEKKEAQISKITKNNYLPETLKRMDGEKTKL